CKIRLLASDWRCWPLGGRLLGGGEILAVRRPEAAEAVAQTEKAAAASLGQARQDWRDARVAALLHARHELFYGATAVLLGFRQLERDFEGLALVRLHGLAVE